MVARVTHVKVEPEDVEEAVRLFDDSVVPAAEREEGFMGALPSPPGQEKPRLSGAFSRALCRTRTGDPFLTMEVLYQLS